MTTFAADLHIHSRFSRATSKALTIRNLAAWAEVKGLSVLGTGDCTHPGWLDEIERELVEDGSGLLRLRDPGSLEGQIPDMPLGLSGGARFMLQGEISSIYKRGGKVRKVHNLVYLPTLEAARALNVKLAQVGNLASDGRPILGLDSRNLLEMVLETHPEAFLIPAHIWTPWFSLFGSMSGFDSVEECYGDLSNEIFAMETGLSSDPSMNWTISALDRYRMISNSDAHSGEKLAREANLFQGEASFSSIRGALRAHLTGEQGDCEFLGTVEFFPEEGKYHLDGHRKCAWSMEPAETLAHKGLCPVCGKPATLGVLHRVLALADRNEPQQPQNQPGYDSLIPLREVLSELLDSGPNTKTVTGEYYRLLGRLGPELAILRETPLADVRKASPILADALERMRAGKVLRASGYDGEFGVITVFSPEERAEMRQGGRLLPATPRRGRKKGSPQASQSREGESDPDQGEREPSAQAGLDIPLAAQVTGSRADPQPHVPAFLNPEQTAAAEAGPGPVLVLAGPGTGKTHTLLERVLRLLHSGVPAQEIAVVTFTRRAAAELRERLAVRLGPSQPQPVADTLHALALTLWAMRRGKPPVLLAEEAVRKLFLEAMPVDLRAGRAGSGSALYAHWMLCRERLNPLTDGDVDHSDIGHAARHVAEVKALHNLADFTDLIEFMLAEVCTPDFHPPFAHLLIDEVQDLSALQLEAVMGLAGAAGQGFFAIGDPNQSIYGFRGATGDVLGRLSTRWPELKVVGLRENYRSGQVLLDASAAVLTAAHAQPFARLHAKNERPCEVRLIQTPDAQHEARLIAERVRDLLGATSSTLHNADAMSLAPGDIAVLVRTRALLGPLKAALDAVGVPCAAPEAEVFWEDHRVAAILRAAEKLYGLPAPVPLPEPGQADAPPQPELPEFLLVQGPRVLPNALRESPPFDRLFWEGRAFRDLLHAFDEQGGWVGLIDWLRLQAGLAEIRQSAQKVRLLTLHASKGLEFEAVFLPALEDGLLPFAGAGALLGHEGASLDAEVEEERRLLYVGMTRAKCLLVLSWAARRTLYGHELALPASRFLAQLPQELVRRTVLAPHTAARQTHLSLF